MEAQGLATVFNEGNYYVKQKISNRSDIPSIERYVYAYDFRMDVLAKKMVLSTIVQYIDTADGNKDVTSKFAINQQDLVAVNTKLHVLTDNSNNPIKETISVHEIIEGQPQFNENGSKKMVDKVVDKTIGLHDFLWSLASLPIPIVEQFKLYITQNDTLGTYQEQ